MGSPLPSALVRHCCGEAAGCGENRSQLAGVPLGFRGPRLVDLDSRPTGPTGQAAVYIRAFLERAYGRPQGRLQATTLLFEQSQKGVGVPYVAREAHARSVVLLPEGAPALGTREAGGRPAHERGRLGRILD